MATTTATTTPLGTGDAAATSTASGKGKQATARLTRNGTSASQVRLGDSVLIAFHTLISKTLNRVDRDHLALMAHL